MRYYKKAMPAIRTSVLISPDFYELCKEHRIVFAEAMRVGISVKLAEKGIGEYDNPLNLKRRIEQLTERLEETSQKYYDLLDKQDRSK